MQTDSDLSELRKASETHLVFMRHIKLRLSSHCLGTFCDGLYLLCCLSLQAPWWYSDAFPSVPGGNNSVHDSSESQSEKLLWEGRWWANVTLWFGLGPGVADIVKVSLEDSLQPNLITQIHNTKNVVQILFDLGVLLSQIIWRLCTPRCPYTRMSLTTFRLERTRA